mmetsp:Transcript_42271/g.70393  ORF Transcript_42271/g.70393 Transcript_42271/m.70393 type:complete len:283 (-) Transcript_42271:194-1042(-)
MEASVKGRVEEVGKLQGELDMVRGQLDKERERWENDFKQERDAHNASIGKLTSEYDQLKEAHTKLTIKFKDERETFEEVRQQMMEEKLRLADMVRTESDELEKLAKEKRVTTDKAEGASSEVKRLQKELQEKQALVDKLKSEKAQVEKANERVGADLASLLSTVHGNRAAQDRLLQQRDDLATELQKNIQRIEQLETAHQAMTAQLNLERREREQARSAAHIEEDEARKRAESQQAAVQSASVNRLLTKLAAVRAKFEHSPLFSGETALVAMPMPTVQLAPS